MADIDASFKKPELKVVLDTNVRISALLRVEKPAAIIKAAENEKNHFSSPSTCMGEGADSC